LTWQDNIEHDRLKTVCQNVKNTLERLRPGRTWLNVIDWNDSDHRDPSEIYEILYPWMVMPDEGQIFFGTNFLHMWLGRFVDPGGTVQGVSLLCPGSSTTSIIATGFLCGSSRTLSHLAGGSTNTPETGTTTIITISNPSILADYNTFFHTSFSLGVPFSLDGIWGNPTTETHLFSHTPIPSAILSDTLYAQAKNRLKVHYEKFCNYACYMYSFDSTGIQERAPAAPLTPVTSIPSPPPGFSYLPYTYTFGQYGNDFISLIDNENVNLGIDILNDGLTDCMQLVCSDLSQYGFQYKGQTTNVTEDTLILVIAQYFGFDPGTGKDL
jgi:hypothetical protein